MSNFKFGHPWTATLFHYNYSKKHGLLEQLSPRIVLIGSAALTIDLDLENTEKQTTHKGRFLIEEIKT